MNRASALAVSLLLVLSCTTTTHSSQWNHEWARGAVFYEIFVRSFADSNGDGVGDFNGLTAKLDYLDDLGIDGIWLMPTFESTSYHGYDTTDYDQVERDYGSEADFQRFLNEAHKRGIRVILDLVLNHTSVEHPWFHDPAKRDWYVWSATDPGWKQPWGGNDPSWHARNGAYYYGAFWSGMPDVNYRNAEAKAEMFRITREWLSRGVDGYRLDATRYLIETGPGEQGQADTPGTHQVLRELSAEVRRVRPDAILVAENTVDVATMATYFGSMPMNFNFPLASAILESLKSNDATRIRTTLNEILRLYPREIIDTPFLANHDQQRIATTFANDERKLRSAAAILLTLPGMPFLYYGEEVGLQNGPTTADESKRTPMPWTASGGFSTATPWHPYAPGVATQNVASQIDDPRSLLSHYRNWIATRKRSTALSKGSITLIDSAPEILAFVRQTPSERVLVVHNLGDAPFDARSLGVNARELLYGDSDNSTLPPHGSAAWRLP